MMINQAFLFQLDDIELLGFIENQFDSPDYLSTDVIRMLARDILRRNEQHLVSNLLILLDKRKDAYVADIIVRLFNRRLDSENTILLMSYFFERGLESDVLSEYCVSIISADQSEIGSNDPSRMVASRILLLLDKKSYLDSLRSLFLYETNVFVKTDLASYLLRHERDAASLNFLQSNIRSNNCEVREYTAECMNLVDS